MTQSTKHFVLFGTTIAAVLLAGAIFLRQRKRQKLEETSLDKVEIPKNWEKIGEVGELILYPLKGGKRKCLTEIEFTKIGLREIYCGKIALQDRIFVVFDEDNEFVNGKKNLSIMLVETSAVDETKVKFSFPDAKDLIVQIPTDSSSVLHKLKFWFGEKVQTVDCGEEAATWFSQVILGKPSGVRLGCFVQSLVPARSIQGAYEGVVEAYSKLHSEYLGAYADVASYMVMTEESVKDLNSRLANPVSEHHFRPNLVVKGCPAYSEDSWDWLRVNDVVLRTFKYCTRCIVTTVDPDTLNKDKYFEPLRTLRTYRQVKEPEIRKIEHDTPVMGMYMGCHKPGFVKVGDPVYINCE